MSLQKQQNIPIVAIVGPTASGKTALGVEVAKSFNGEIISADSMQIYKGMQIATAKPSVEEMQGIPHHLMGFLNTEEVFSVADYVRKAHEIIQDINSRSKLPIIVGGTGLYIDSLLNNITFSQDSNDFQLRKQLEAQLAQYGVQHLLEQLQLFDPESAEKLSVERNPKRIIRAIEMFKTTGITMTEHNEKSKEEKSIYQPVKIGLTFKDRELLYQKINHRVDVMLADGLLDECKEVLSRPLSETAVKAIGYKEFIPYLNNKKSLNECIDTLKMETRRYAKRQLTWFKRDTETNWIFNDSFDTFEDLKRYCFSILISRGFEFYG